MFIASIDFSSDISIKGIASIILAIILLKISIIDIQALRISNRLCIIGTAFGLVTNCLIVLSTYYRLELSLISEFFYTPILTLLIINRFCLTSRFYLRRELLGLGDSKLISMGSAWVGAKGILITICLAFLLAGFYSLYNLLNKSLTIKQVFPFAPFISVGILGVWILGSNWWLNHLNMLMTL